MKRKPVKPLSPDIAPAVETPAEDTRPTRFFIAWYNYKIFSRFTNGQTEVATGAGEYYVTAKVFPSQSQVRGLLCEFLSEKHGKTLDSANLIINQFTEVSEEDYTTAKSA